MRSKRRRQGRGRLGPRIRGYGRRRGGKWRLSDASQELVRADILDLGSGLLALSELHRTDLAAGTWEGQPPFVLGPAMPRYGRDRASIAAPAKRYRARSDRRPPRSFRGR